jgi:hypothetical protein
MRFKARIKALFQDKEIAKKVLSDRFLVTVNEEVVDKVILDLISKGISPVEGKKFKSYKDKDKYPGKLKPAKPVNLYLEGDMLKTYEAKRKTDKSFEVGVMSNDEKVQDYAKYNNSGTKHIAARRFIPLKGEQFSSKVRKAFRDVLRKRLQEVLAARRRGK